MARCETKGGKPRLVFVSRRLPKTGHPAALRRSTTWSKTMSWCTHHRCVSRRSKDTVPWFLKGLFNSLIASFLLTPKSTIARAAAPSTRTPYRILHDLLYHVADGKHHVLVPDYKHMRSRMIAAFHDLPVSGHLGWHKAHDALSQHYY